jgi:hypothetical protein
MKCDYRTDVKDIKGNTTCYFCGHGDVDDDYCINDSCPIDPINRIQNNNCPECKNHEEIFEDIEPEMVEPFKPIGPFKQVELNYPSHKSVQIGGSHYKNFKIQPIEFFMANQTPYAEAAVMKYVLRYKYKNGKEDLLKAKHIIDMLIEENYP